MSGAGPGSRPRPAAGNGPAATYRLPGRDVIASSMATPARAKPTLALRHCAANAVIRPVTGIVPGSAIAHMPMISPRADGCARSWTSVFAEAISQIDRKPVTAIPANEPAATGEAAVATMAAPVQAGQQPDAGRGRLAGGARGHQRAGHRAEAERRHERAVPAAAEVEDLAAEQRHRDREIEQHAAGDRDEHADSDLRVPPDHGQPVDEPVRWLGWLAGDADRARNLAPARR